MDDSFRSLLRRRKTTRKQKRGILAVQDLKDLIFAAYGHTHDWREIAMRTAPSAGACYPIELYFALEDIDNTLNGLYRYDTSIEDISLVTSGNFLKKIQAASYDQKFISQCNLAVIMVYNPRKIVSDYGENAFKYSAMECGHIAQNILLMATSLDLGAAPIGAFDRDGMSKLIGIEDFKEALYVITVGKIS